MDWKLMAEASPTPRSDERYDYVPIGARPNSSWPGGKKLAIYVAIGVEDYRFGDGQTEDFLEGASAPDLVNTAWRDYGNRIGAFRLLHRLEGLGIAPTILLNTAVYDAAPDVLVAARAVGAEIVAHGISNSDSLWGMTEPEEREYLTRVADRIRDEEGNRPLGWSSPWLSHTESTLDVLAETGYRYVMDLRADDQPVWIKTRTEPILAIPYGLEINDSSTVIGRKASASEFADMIIDEFDELLLASSDQPLVMSIIVHSFISGVPFRLRQLTRALEHIASHRDEVWFTQPNAIYLAALDRVAPVAAGTAPGAEPAVLAAGPTGGVDVSH
jgi:peptidoglycan/xylan/chitin deacetylase (PgdA/CDA1 family)